MMGLVSRSLRVCSAKPHWARASSRRHARYENGMHGLRHFFASALLDQGESIKAVAEWLGHTDPAFTHS